MDVCNIFEQQKVHWFKVQKIRRRFGYDRSGLGSHPNRARWLASVCRYGPRVRGPSSWNLGTTRYQPILGSSIFYSLYSAPRIHCCRVGLVGDLKPVTPETIGWYILSKQGTSWTVKTWWVRLVRELSYNSPWIHRQILAVHIIRVKMSQLKPQILLAGPS